VSLPKGENPLDIDFERAKELIDEKAIADAPVAFYKGEVFRKVLAVLVLYKMEWIYL
jgi:DNA topoisomerase-1